MTTRIPPNGRTPADTPAGLRLPAPVRALLDDANHAVLSTLQPDGSPQTSVVWVGRDGDDVLVSSQDGRRKVKNVRADARVSLLLLDRRDPERYTEIRGTATVAEDVDRALAVALALAEKYEGEGAGREYLELPPEQVRVTIRITPARLTGPVR
ncbi:PPOX class F420-dependent oxidoreductase [Streptomyces filamentosus]|uniref:PPOX class F420-dependent oxidoreductase n=1 Tax=Streptomyces filamentosus TaxID=67294 RepID=UPI00123AD651|nr:PPOX class F420-dependent oxidoreductase [Streptomyces filamentosus]KAA6219738.1 PPOX class F420-dependent oxidoreductase [Streptomyces filamentosus]